MVLVMSEPDHCNPADKVKTIVDRMIYLKDKPDMLSMWEFKRLLDELDLLQPGKATWRTFL